MNAILAFPEPEPQKPTAAVVAVTSEVARRWLDERNTKNRKVRDVAVRRYKTDMLTGRWTFAADPIRFAQDGTLLDGQHRLIALAECGEEGSPLTIPFLIVRGLAAESQQVMDQGSKRTPGDQLALLGVRDANAVAAAVKQYLAWEQDLLFRDNRLISAATTSAQIEGFVVDNPSLIEAFRQVITTTKQNDAPPSIAGAFALRAIQIDPDAATEFFRYLASGGKPVGHPINTLDKRLQRHRREGLKMSHRDYLALFILAWNAWREGRTMVKFQRPRGGSWNTENFPEPK